MSPFHSTYTSLTPMLHPQPPQVTRFSNGVQEWYGETAKGGCFIFPFSPAVNNNNSVLLCRQQRVPEGVGPGFPPRQETGTSVEVLDMKRVEAALATLHEEEDIADAMSGKPPRERRRLPPATAAAAAEQGGGQREGVEPSSTAASGKRAERAGSASVARSCGGEDGESATASETRGAQTVTAAGIAADEHNQASGSATVAVTGRKRRVRDVLAVYRHRGAQLVLEQSRKRHPFRQEGVFCRQDRGEWAGQVTLDVLFTFSWWERSGHILSAVGGHAFRYQQISLDQAGFFA